ncbi:spermidine/putrescine ABC transporter substrate-binding protein [Luedemannella flava]
MRFHPREGRGPSPTRRQFLRLGGLSLVAATGALAGCERPGRGGGPGTATVDPVALSRPDRPARLPLYPDAPAIADGLSPEKGGTFKIFNYAEYLSPDVTKAFGKKYGVTVEVTTFTTQDEAVAKLRTAGSAFDVYFPTPDILGRLAAGKLLQPLNHTYLPNLKNAWPQLQDPFYDQGAQYTVPYTAYTTGVGYRADKVKSVPANGWDLLWDPAYKGRAYVLDDYREALSMALLRAGNKDLNTEDPAALKAAGDALRQLVDAVNIKIGIAAYQTVPEGQATVHHCWSGDIINAQYYLPKDVDASVLGYWYPADLAGPVGTDCMAIPKAATKPVLAHLFLNHLLDNDVALENFSFTGYQPALAAATPEKLTADEFIAPNLTSAVVTADHYAKGLQELQLSLDGETTWNNQWAAFKAGR